MLQPERSSLHRHAASMSTQRSHVLLHAQLPVTLLDVDISDNALTRLDGLETLTSLRWLDASRNALKASVPPAAP